MSETTKEVTTTEKPTEIVQPGKIVETATTTTETESKVVPQVAEPTPEGGVQVEDAPTHDGTRFR